MKIFISCKRSFNRVKLGILGLKIKFVITNKEYLNTLVPVGVNCYVRKILTKYGIKPRKKHYEKSFPFDFSVFPISSVAEVLSNDFETFFDDLKYIDGQWVNSNYRACFRHDKFKENEKEKFIARYVRRIDNFKEMFLKNKKILFISALEENDLNVNSINTIYKYIEDHKQDGNFAYLVFNFAKWTENRLNNKLNENIVYKEMVYPGGNFIDTWYRDKSTNPLPFEKHEQAFVSEVISSL